MNRIKLKTPEQLLKERTAWDEVVYLALQGEITQKLEMNFQGDTVSFGLTKPSTKVKELSERLGAWLKESQWRITGLTAFDNPQDGTIECKITISPMNLPKAD